MQADLTGVSVLVVEDEYFTAKEIRDSLRVADARVLGPYSNQEAALMALAQSAPRCALIDFNIRGGNSIRLASELKARGIPFAFVTGCSVTEIPAEFSDSRYVLKPAGSRELVDVVMAMTAARAA